MNKFLLVVGLSLFAFLIGLSLIFRTEWWLKSRSVQEILKYPEDDLRNQYYIKRLKIGGVVLIIIALYNFTIIIKNLIN